MKIAIFSDSHGDTHTMCKVVEKENPEMIIYLGDGITDAEYLNKKFPEIEMIKVLGGIDSNENGEEFIKLIDICGKRFIITHGHTLIPEYKDGIRTDQNRIESRINMLKIINDKNADILLHGHTHEPHINRIQITPQKACWIMNPGRIGCKNYPNFIPTYGILKINEFGLFDWKFVEVK